MESQEILIETSRNCA